jgi:hypothetical protein
LFTGYENTADGTSVHDECKHRQYVCTQTVRVFTDWMFTTTEYISLREMKQGQCICPLSWSVPCNFTGDGKGNESGWASWANFTLMMECIRQKAAVAILCTLCPKRRIFHACVYLRPLSSCFQLLICLQNVKRIYTVSFNELYK